jgi:hypothetical protein
MAVGPHVVDDWQLGGTYSSFTLEYRVDPSFCNGYEYVDFSEGNFNVKGVLRMGTSTRSPPPIASSHNPRLVDEIQIRSLPVDDYYTVKNWTYITPELTGSRSEQLTVLLLDYLGQAEASENALDNVRAGYSGRKFQNFMNLIGGIPDTRYLEVGVFNGSSLISILEGNNPSGVVAVDLWDPADPEVTTMKNQVVSYVQGRYNQSGNVHILHQSCWEVRPSTVTALLGGPVTVYFYDAGHSLTDHYLALAHYYAALTDEFIFIVDDWNWSMVRKGTYAALELFPVQIVAQIEITTTVGDALRRQGATGSWHMGMTAFVIRKLA